MSFRKTLVLTAVVFALLSAQVSAELILNGSLESPGIVGADIAYPHPDVITSWTSPARFGWYMLGTPPSTYGGGWPAAHDGNYLVNFIEPGHTLSQSFSVTAGLEHTASFWQLQRSTTATMVAAVTLDAGGHTGSLGLTTNAGDAVWTQYTFAFTPDTTTTATLSFRGVQSNDGVFMDDVSVTAIPEPGTLALLATGLLGLLCYAWRKRK